METSYTIENNSQILPVSEVYPLIAVRGSIPMPEVTVTIDLTREKSVTTAERAVERNSNIVFVGQRRENVDNPAPKDLVRVGTVCKVKQLIRMPNQVVRLVIVGVGRVKIHNFVAINPCFEVETEAFPDRESDSIEVAALQNMLAKSYGELLSYNNKVPMELQNHLDTSAPDAFSYNIASLFLDADDKKVAFLTLDRLQERMERVLIELTRMLEILKVEKRIAQKVHKAMEQSQKEYFLREQVKAIQEELGDVDEELAGYEERIKKLPKVPREKALKELARIKRMSSNSPEVSVARTYIEWLLDLPWTELSLDNENLSHAKSILDADHFGLEKVKERILEYIAVMSLTKTNKGPILCFVGPPGVGKTSIVRSIAHALERKFVTMSLGGVKDEAEIRGHRRTYVGALPGSIIYHMKQAGVMNPVFLFDEIDKMSSSYNGDPASAMLEVLDPEQNSHFSDHYLEMSYDLSKVLFVTTANTLDSIPAPLLDRMEVIELSGYTEDEKVAIANKYLVNKQCVANGLTAAKIDMQEEAIRMIITAYTRESGVRNLERSIGSVCRKIVCKIVDGDESGKFVVDKTAIENYLGVPKFMDDEMATSDEVGEATGLAWTSVGGTTLPIEVALIEGGKGEIILTGKLGDVMKESARTAISVVRTHAAEYSIDPKRFEAVDIHLHVPEGATPKDGPSAGITIATAVLSAFAGRPVDRYVAMTGEITLRGKVLPIGGLKEKVLAAHRMGIRTIIIPKANEKDLSEISSDVKEKLAIHTVSDVSEVFQLAIKG